MAEKAKSSNNTMVLALVIGAAALLGIGGYLYQKQQNTKTVSLELGGKSISATFSQ